MILFTDATIVRRIPPLAYSWSRVASQQQVPVEGTRAVRVVYGTTCIQTGTTVLQHCERWNQESFQDHLRKIARTWRGWNVVLFLDRGSPHRAKNTRKLAAELGIELRFLPTACCHLNPIESLWRVLKRRIWCNSDMKDLIKDVTRGISHIQSLTGSAIQKICGVLSPDFWLREYRSGVLCGST